MTSMTDKDKKTVTYTVKLVLGETYKHRFPAVCDYEGCENTATRVIPIYATSSKGKEVGMRRKVCEAHAVFFRSLTPLEVKAYHVEEQS